MLNNLTDLGLASFVKLKWPAFSLNKTVIVYFDFVSSSIIDVLCVRAWKGDGDITYLEHIN
jgi:hypothetical protein